MSEVKKPSRKELAEAATSAGQDYEIVQGEFWGRSCKVFKNAPQTLRQLFEENRSDETFLVYQDERYSFDETWRKAAQIARILAEDYGVEKGDRVAISMRNFPEWVLAFNAVTSMGAIAVAMNSLWLSDEMAYGINDSGAKVLFADQERIDRLAQVSDQGNVRVIAVRPQQSLPEDIADLSALMASKGDVDMPDVANFSAQDPATIFYTSGSTGYPKGVLSCHGNIITSLMSWELEAALHAQEFEVEAPELDYQQAVLLGVPLFHATGSHAVMLMSYRAQRKMVSMFKWSAKEGAELVDREKITSFVAPAAMTGDLIEEAKAGKYDLSSLLVVGGGGAPRAPDQVRSIEKAFAKALPNTGWGMTETNAIGTGIGGQDYLDHPASCGRPVTIVEVRIVDENDTPLPVGERGEVQIRGASMFEGYWQRPDANAEVFTEDFWMHTGDVGYLDDENYLYIVDRIKDLVIRGGENIGCAEVEAALLEHDAVLEASVYGIPDERMGEEVGATIYCGDNDLTEEALRDFMVAHVARFKVPRYLSFSSEPLPRIASGKIDKKAIRAVAQELHAG